MAELITREDTIKYLNTNMNWYDENGNIADDDIKLNQITDLVYAIQGVEERKQGEWIKDYDNSALDGLYHCSVCSRKLWVSHDETLADYPFCHCGADMRGSKNGKIIK